MSWFKKQEPESIGLPKCKHETCSPWEEYKTVAVYDKYGGHPVERVFQQMRSCLVCGYTEIDEQVIR